MKGTEPVYTNGGVNNYSPALSHGENLYFIDYGKGC